MPIFHVFAPTCSWCGAFLTPGEREGNLLVMSSMIVHGFPGGMRLCCGACYEDEMPDPS